MALEPFCFVKHEKCISSSNKQVNLNKYYRYMTISFNCNIVIKLKITKQIFQKNVHVTTYLYKVQLKSAVLTCFQSMLTRMESIIGQMKKEKETSVSEVKSLKSDLQGAVNKIKVSFRQGWISAGALLQYFLWLWTNTL